VENVLAHGYLHKLFLLFKVLEAKAALLLTGHVVGHLRDIRSVLTEVAGGGGQFCRAESDFLHDFKVDSDHSFRLLVQLVVIELSIFLPAFQVAWLAFLTLFGVNVKEADDLKQDNDEKEEDAQRQEYHDDAVRQVLVFQVESLVSRLRFLALCQLEEPDCPHYGVD